MNFSLEIWVSLSDCGSTVRRKIPTKSSSDRGKSHNEERKSWGCSSPSSDSGQSGKLFTWKPKFLK